MQPAVLDIHRLVDRRHRDQLQVLRPKTRVREHPAQVGSGRGQDILAVDLRQRHLERDQSLGVVLVRDGVDAARHVRSRCSHHRRIAATQ